MRTVVREPVRDVVASIHQLSLDGFAQCAHVAAEGDGHVVDALSGGVLELVLGLQRTDHVTEASYLSGNQSEELLLTFGWDVAHDQEGDVRRGTVVRQLGKLVGEPDRHRHEQPDRRIVSGLVPVQW